MRYAGHIRFLVIVNLTLEWISHNVQCGGSRDGGGGGHVRLPIVNSSRAEGHSWLPFGQQIICILQVRPKKSQ